MKTQVERWIDRLRKAAGAKGSADADVDDGFTASIQVEDLSILDFGFLGRVRYATASTTVAAVAAQFGTFQIFNPLGSGLLCVVDLIWINQSAAPVSVNIGHIDTTSRIGGLANVNPVPRDMRWQPTLGAASSVVYEAGATATVIPNQVHGAWNDSSKNSLLVPQTFVLAPNNKGICIQNNTVNIATGFNILIHERVPDPAELT